MLQAIRLDRQLDIRELIVQGKSTQAVHSRENRLRPEEIESLHQVDEACAARRPRLFAVVDDVLTTGVHCCTASSVLSTPYPGVRVVGLFLARREPEPADPTAFDAVIGNGD